MEAAAIYPFEKTGFMLSVQNEHMFSDADLAKWDAAIEEYHRLHGQG